MAAIDPDPDIRPRDDLSDFTHFYFADQQRSKKKRPLCLNLRFAE